MYPLNTSQVPNCRIATSSRRFYVKKTKSPNKISDLTQGWTDTLYFPDTVAILTIGTGIEENAAASTFGLAQNTPNPFNGATNVNLNLTETVRETPLSMWVP